MMEMAKSILVMDESTYQLVDEGTVVYEESKFVTSTNQKIMAKDYSMEPSKFND